MSNLGERVQAPSLCIIEVLLLLQPRIPNRKFTLISFAFCSLSEGNTLIDFMSPLGRTAVLVAIALTLGAALLHFGGTTPAAVLPTVAPPSSPTKAPRHEEQIAMGESVGLQTETPAHRQVADETPRAETNEVAEREGLSPLPDSAKADGSGHSSVYDIDLTTRFHPMAHPPSVSSGSHGAKEAGEDWWGDEKGKVFAAWRDQHLDFCQSNKQESDDQVVFSANPLQEVVGFSNDRGGRTRSGQWNRFWIKGVGHESKAASSGKTPQCRSGDIYQILLESPGAKVDVYRVYDLGMGLHEVHFFLRRPGRYTLCVDLTHSQAGYPEPMRSRVHFAGATTPRATQAEANPGDQWSGALGKMCVARDGPPKKRGEATRNRRHQFTQEEVCMGTAQTTCLVTEGNTLTPPADQSGKGKFSCHLPRKGTQGQPPTLRLAHPHMFRSGAWVKMPGAACDTLHCVGDLRDLNPTASLSPVLRQRDFNAANVTESAEDFLTDGFSQSWVWASDYCTMGILKPPAQYPAPSLGGDKKAKRSATGAPSSLNLRGTQQGGRRGTLDRQWILGWGDSTLKQPLSNMVEYNLQHPVLKASGHGPLFMEDIPKLQRKMKREGRSAKSIAKASPSFFSYREWDCRAPELEVSAQDDATVTLPPFRVSFTWGGCPGIAAAPSACPAIIGMTNTRSISRYLKSVKRQQEPSASVSSVPALVLLEHFHWRAPTQDETIFVKNMNSTFTEVLFPSLGIASSSATDEDVETENQPSPPSSPQSVTRFGSSLVVWNGFPHHMHNEDIRAQCVWPPPLPMARHFRLVVEEYWDSMFTLTPEQEKLQGQNNKPGGGKGNVIFVDRSAVTNPLHFGDRYGHFGVHYGSSHGMCHTGKEEGYARSECKRDTLADDAMVMMWLNLLNAVG